MTIRGGSPALAGGLLALLFAAAPAAGGPPAHAQANGTPSTAPAADPDAAASCDPSGAGGDEAAGTTASDPAAERRSWGPLWLDEAHPSRVQRHGSLREPPPAHGLGLPDGDCGSTTEPANPVLVDDAGVPVAELGEAQVDGTVRSVAVQTAVAEPVVITGPATAHDGEPGVVRVRAAGADAFQVQLQEWAYLDGLHAVEDVPYLVLTSGRHVMSDGSVWEAGTVEAEGGVWQHHPFSQSFPEPPLLLLSVQSSNEDDPVTARARAVRTGGFEAALFEEEGSSGAHAPERVGYLAVWSPSRSGRVATQDGGSLPYLVRRVEADARRLPVLSTSLWLAEERSADDELDHVDEGLDFLALGRGVFAQGVTFQGGDPFAVRRAAPEHGAALEWGTLPDLDPEWQTVPLSRSYEHPVVVVRPLSYEGRDPAVVRIRNAASDGFEARVQEWSYLNGVHAFERAFYLVAELGIQAVGALTVEAATLESAKVLAEGWEEPAFHAPFPETPAVFGSVMTVNDVDPVTVRIAGRTPSGFRLTMQEEEARVDGHAAETLGWIAVQRGRTVTADGRAVVVFDSIADSGTLWKDFGASLRGRLPFLVGQVGSTNGSDPVELRYVALEPGRVLVTLREEQSADTETSHGFENLSLLAAE